MLTTLGNILSNLESYCWKEWVYVSQVDDISPTTGCAILNPDEAELGSDGFTPLAVERAGMKEFLSVQDLAMIIKRLEVERTQVTTSDKCKASVYYFENDAFMPDPKA